MPMLDSYLFFNGNCAEAMNFYHRTLGGEMQAMLTYGQSPEPEACAAGDIAVITPRPAPCSASAG